MRLAPSRALRRQRRLQVLPALRHAAARDARGAIGIVEVEYLRLRDRVRGAEAGGMRGIAFHLDRPAGGVANQHAARIATKHAGGREHVAAVRDGIGGGRTGGISSPPGAPSSQPPSPASAMPAAISCSTRRRSRGAASAAASEGNSCAARATKDGVRASSSRLRHCRLSDGISSNPSGCAP